MRTPQRQKESDALLQYFQYAFKQGKLISIPVVDTQNVEKEEWMIISKEGQKGYPLALLMLDPVEAAARYPAMVTAPSDTPLKDELEKREPKGTPALDKAARAGKMRRKRKS